MWGPVSGITPLITVYALRAHEAHQEEQSYSMVLQAAWSSPQSPDLFTVVTGLLVLHGADPHATLMGSVPDRSGWNQPFAAVLLFVAQRNRYWSCSLWPLSICPGVLAGPPGSAIYGLEAVPANHAITHGCAVLEWVDNLYKQIGLQVLAHISDMDIAIFINS